MKISYFLYARLQTGRITPGTPQHAGCKLCCDRGVSYSSERTGSRGKFLHIISIYGYNLQENICLRKKASIKEYMDTIIFPVRFLVLSNTSTQFGRSEEMCYYRMFMIKDQDNALFYRHFYVTNNYVLIV